jgi:hypothetical protein
VASTSAALRPHRSDFQNFIQRVAGLRERQQFLPGWPVHPALA